MSFSYESTESNVPIAYMRQSSNHNNKILYYDKTGHADEDQEPDDDLLMSLFGKRAMRTKTAREQKREEMDHSSVKSVERVPNSQYKYEIIPYSLNSGTDDFRRNVYCIVGRSGSGKSYIAKQLCNMYRRVGGIKKFYMISATPDDGYKAKMLDINKFVARNSSFEEQKNKYEEMKIRFKHKKKMIDDPVTIMKMELALHEIKPKKDLADKLEFTVDVDDIKAFFKDSVLILDDYEDLADAKKIQYLQDFLLNCGRHTKTHMLILRHNALGPSTRLIKSELTNLIMFQSSSAHQRNVLLRKYMDFSLEEAKRIGLSLRKSRWVNINTGLMPRYVLTQTEAYVL